MNPLDERGHLLTEQVNPASQNLDQLDSLALVKLFAAEDQKPSPPSMPPPMRSPKPLI